MSANELTSKVRELKELKAMADELAAEITAIEDAIKALEPNGVLGFVSMGIHLYSKVFLETFKEYRTVPTKGGNFLFAEYNGHQFMAFVDEEDK